VLDGHLFPGRTQNAGALGSMPAPGMAPNRGPHAAQLVNVASIYVLERKLIAKGCDASMLWQSPDDWGDDLGTALDEWIEEVATSVAFSIVSAIAVVDVETVIIDGAFPVTVRRRIIERTRLALEHVNQLGLSPFRLVEGSIGNAARAIGGASLPLLANFTQDREVLFKDVAPSGTFGRPGRSA
jgi:predicted NBD/HSP70 family sugar kinase